MKLGIQQRSFAIAIEDRAAKDGIFSASFSSENLVRRDYGWELLDHSPAAVDLSRFQDGAAVRDSHSGDQIGVVEASEVKDRKLRGTIRLGISARAKEIAEDVKNKIRRHLSIRYQVNKIQPDSEKDGLPVYRVTSWQPIHVAFEPDPADPSVGVGRNLMNTNQNSVQEAQRAQVTGEIDPDIREAEVVEILAHAAHIGKPEVFRAAREFIEQRKSSTDFKHWLLRNFYKAQPIQVADIGADEIGMSQKDLSGYSLVRAINQIARGKALDGLELECSRAVQKKVGRETEGFFIPGDVQQQRRIHTRTANTGEFHQRDLKVGTLTQGGALVEAEIMGSNMIEYLRNSTLLVKLGARTLSGLQGDAVIPRQTGTATCYWLAEDSEVTASALALGQVAGTPHRVSAMTIYSKQLLAQGSIDVESLVRRDLMGALAVERDRVGIAGTGVAGEPLGITVWPNINATVTFGGAPVWADVCEFENGIEVDNALTASCAYLSTPATRKRWKTAVKETGYPIYLLEGSTTNGYGFYATNNFPSGDKVLFGNFSDVYLLDWIGMEVVVDPFTLAHKHSVRIVMTMLVDNIVRNAVSFNLSTDSGAQA